MNSIIQREYIMYLRLSLKTCFKVRFCGLTKYFNFRSSLRLWGRKAGKYLNRVSDLCDFTLFKVPSHISSDQIHSHSLKQILSPRFYKAYDLSVHGQSQSMYSYRTVLTYLASDSQSIALPYQICHLESQHSSFFLEFTLDFNKIVLWNTAFGRSSDIQLFDLESTYSGLSRPLEKHFQEDKCSKPAKFWVYNSTK